jgi:hypothetical protein
MIEIKHRINGKVLYTAENASDVREAVEEAVKAKANLDSADLRCAELRSANLRSANLRYANLRYADLRSANLRYADLRSANLGYADLGYADLGYADLRYADLRYADLRYARHPLWIFQQDFFSILDRAPAEVAGLRQTMVEGRIDGSTYSGSVALVWLDEWIASRKRVGAVLEAAPSNTSEVDRG